jgi:acyl-coenzyme A synthetase/AMP-(fatty) acid ligase
MLSVFDQGAPVPCPAPFNLAAYVMGRAETLGEKAALVIFDDTSFETWTYQALEAAVRGTGAGLLAAGLTPGDRVLMRLGNSVDFPIAYLGALAAGLVPVPTSSMLTAPEVARIAEDLQVRAVLQDPSISGVAHGFQISVMELRAMRRFAPCDWHMGDPDRLGYIVYTSGSSGKPRAVAHAHRAIWARRMMFDDWYGLRENDRLLHAGAFNWTYTLGTGLMDPWTCGATSLIPAPGTAPERLPELLDRGAATIFASVPGVYRKILKSVDSLQLPRLRHGLTAGEKLSEQIGEDWAQATGTPLFEAYGMSECSTFISSGPTHPAPVAALGRPQVGRRVAIVGQHGPVARGEPGVIAVQKADPGLMLGYLNADDPFDGQMQDDWFRTGDRGVMDDGGWITFLGRDDDMMNAGGYRVSPLEVETALSRHPGIEQIGVIDVEVKPDVRIVTAFYTAASQLPEDALVAFAETCLAGYKQPKAWVHVQNLPTNANGKLQRKSLRPLYKADE